MQTDCGLIVLDK